MTDDILKTISLLCPTVTYLSRNSSLSTDRAHLPSTIISASLKSMILNDGPCRPSYPFEEDGSRRPTFGNKLCFYFSTCNLKITRELVVLLTTAYFKESLQLCRNEKISDLFKVIC